MIPPKKRDTNSLMACISSLQTSLHLSWLFSQFAWVSSEINTSTGFMSLSIFQEASLPSFFPSGLCAEGTRQCLMEFLHAGVSSTSFLCLLILSLDQIPCDFILGRNIFSLGVWFSIKGIWCSVLTPGDQ